MNYNTSGMVWYLAHPYTHPSPAKNVERCIGIANHLLDAGFSIYAPIVMTHWLDVGKTRPAAFWYRFDEDLMAKCDGIILSPGWESSKGCVNEMKWFKERGLPVLVHVDGAAPIEYKGE